MPPTVALARSLSVPTICHLQMLPQRIDGRSTGYWCVRDGHEVLAVHYDSDLKSYRCAVCETPLLRRDLRYHQDNVCPCASGQYRAHEILWMDFWWCRQ
jgi:DNA-directed RNA polymerase subunit RPC12/RpoP